MPDIYSEKHIYNVTRRSSNSCGYFMAKRVLAARTGCRTVPQIFIGER